MNAPTLLPPGAVTRTQPRRWLVGGLLETDGAGLLIGAPGSGKSLVACELTRCIATGAPFLGRSVRQGAVLYVAAERGAETDRRLEFAFMSADAGANVRICRDARDLYRDPEGSADALCAAIVACGLALPVRLIVLDTLAIVLGEGEENSARDAARLWRAIERLRTGTGAAILLVHHAKRGEGRARGSQAMEASADIVISVEKKGALGSLRVTKANSVAEGQVLKFGVEVVKLGTDPETGEDSTVAIATTLSGTSSPRALRLPPDAETARIELESLLAADGGEDVSIGAWRSATFSSFGERTAGAKREAWRKVRRVLIERGLISIEGNEESGRVSVSDPSAMRQQTETADGRYASATASARTPSLEGGADGADGAAVRHHLRRRA